MIDTSGCWGGAVGIRGASAAMAISAVLPESEARQRQTLFTVSGGATFSTAAMIFYPIAGDLFNSSSADIGLLIGAMIHDVAQVVRAGYSVSTETGDVATFVKLVCVAVLAPIVMAIAVYCRLEDRTGGGSVSTRPTLPIFLVGFVGLSALNTVVEIPTIMTDGLSQLATGPLLLAVTALGVPASLREVASIGWRPICLLALKPFS